MDIHYYDDEDVKELAGGRLLVGHCTDDHAPVYFDPRTGLTSFGCGTIPIFDDEDR
jgi:hypothetical protein